MNAATCDLVLNLVEFIAFRVHRFEVHNDLRELTRTTGLLLVGVVKTNNWTTDRLAVSNLRLTNVGVNLELATHAVNENVQVQLAHTADDGVAQIGSASCRGTGYDEEQVA